MRTVDILFIFCASFMFLSFAANESTSMQSESQTPDQVQLELPLGETDTPQPVVEAAPKADDKDPIRYVFIDVETSGVDAENDVMLELGVVVTDDSFNVLATFFHALPLSSYPPMDGWIWKHHTDNGLLEECVMLAKSVNHVPQKLDQILHGIHRQLIEMLVSTGAHDGRAIVAGRNVRSFDLKFFQKLFPVAARMLHQRNQLDVRSVLRFFGLERKEAEALAAQINTDELFGETRKHRVRNCLSFDIGLLKHLHQFQAQATKYADAMNGLSEEGENADPVPFFLEPLAEYGESLADEPGAEEISGNPDSSSSDDGLPPCAGVSGGVSVAGDDLRD